MLKGTLRATLVQVGNKGTRWAWRFDARDGSPVMHGEWLSFAKSEALAVGYQILGHILEDRAHERACGIPAEAADG